MPKAIRQENLYGAEDWTLVYTSFKNAEFTSYDFDTLRDSMINYMQVNYPEEFNDYTQNSEFIALLDLVAFVGQNLAFRMDLNARENILDTAEKRESVLRIARMLSYKPKRVRPSLGFLKVTGIVTTDQIIDSTGANLANKSISWGSDPSELDYERFITILDAALSSNNKFGMPVKRNQNTANNTIYEIYNFNNALGLTNYPINATVDGVNLNFDILPVTLDTNNLLSQADPSFDTAFSLMYRNDGKGVGSTKTGFFFLAKQGYIANTIESVSNPVANMSIDIGQSQNISEEDFFVQTLDDNGSVVKTWKRVGTLDFSNIVVNEYSGVDKDVYEVIYSDNDVTSIKFGDGTFTNLPTGNIRIWYRTAENRVIKVKAGEVSNINFDLNYFNSDNQIQTLTLTLELQDNMVTGIPAETVDEIKINAPEAFYSKNRMVTGDDYNGFLPSLNNDVLIMKAENRTFSGHSRYVDLKDPTGKSRPLVEFADDGYLYKQESLKNIFIADDPTRRTIDLLDEYIEKQLGDLGLLNFYYGRLNLTGITGTTAQKYFDGVPLGKTIYYSPTVASILATGSVSSITVSSINTSAAYDNFDVDGGLLQIDNELFSYTGISGSTFTGVTRARQGTAAAAHTAGANVYKVYDYRWRAAYSDLTTSNGFISESNISAAPQKLGFTTGGPLRSLRPGSLVKFEESDGDLKWVTIVDIKGDGLGIENTSDIYTGLLIDGSGPVEINKRVTSQDLLKFIIPPFPRVFDDLTRAAIIDKLDSNQSFALKLDNITPKWDIITTSVSLTSEFNRSSNSTAWLIYVKRETNGWTLTFRQLDYIFGSLELMRFYNINFAPSFNPNFKSVSKDDIVVLTLNSSNKLTEQKRYRISGYYVYDDGYTDNSKVKVTPLDLDNDFLPDDPDHFNEIVGTSSYILLNSYQEGDFTYKVPAAGTSSDLPGTLNLAFKWEHNVDIDQTLNPSLTNIIDVYVLTKSYNEDFMSWKRRNDTTVQQPLPETSEELRSSFNNLISYKMMTDEIIFHPIKFKPLFGSLAEPEFQAQFKVVKSFKSTLTDSEIKSKVINAIDTFFTPGNFSFGETFYFTELAAYIHTSLSRDLSSVVIVPTSETSKFGTLFQIESSRNEIVTSVASVNDVIVINEITDNNIRIGR